VFGFARVIISICVVRAAGVSCESARAGTKDCWFARGVV